VEKLRSEAARITPASSSRFKRLDVRDAGAAEPAAACPIPVAFHIDIVGPAVLQQDRAPARR